MSTLRLHILLGTALIAAAGCAQQPVRADRASPTPAYATAPGAPASSLQAMQSAVPSTLLVFAYDQGWRQVMVSGNDYYFCRADAPSGSLIAMPRCVTVTQLEFLRLTAEQQQQQLAKPLPLDRAG